ncbi:tripartite motif-containing protein 16-like [Engraulis encrasicolus]|uniref:tripartite motif-containing protein 16-like n=1 Tax=Engraulis encrasicolus TaxID=184585 RepID=UPI002FD0F70B
MAACSIAVDENQFTCPICCDLLADPVTIPCGHSYCMACISTYWSDHSRVCSCPQCRLEFPTMPSLGKNNVLADVVEKVRRMTVHAHPLASSGAPEGPGQVECDACIGAKDKAVRSCLVCLASFCDFHLQPHLLSPAFQSHELVEATEALPQKLCARHKRLLEVYCSTDQVCICYQCILDDHKGHDHLLPEAARIQKEKELCEIQKQFQKRKIEKEIALDDLDQTMSTLTDSAFLATSCTDKMFSEIAQALERGCQEVKRVIQEKDMAAGSQAEGVRGRLQREVTELQTGLSELDELTQMQDHISFLHGFDRFPSHKALCDNTSIILNENPSFECVMASVKNFKDKMIALCSKELRSISTAVNGVHLFERTWVRAELIQVACEPTLDPKTHSNRLHLSEGNTKVSGGTPVSPSAVNPERFDTRPQVLCQEGLSGRHYWEVEWSEENGICIGVSYKGIARKGLGHESGLGHNDKSWTLSLSSKADSFITFWHNNTRRVISRATNLRSGRIGVYLDHKAGILTFFNVSDTLNVLHTIKTKFTQALFPGFAVGTDAVIKICKPGTPPLRK